MADKKLIEKIAGMQRNVLMADYTTFKIGGPAKYFFVARNKDDLMQALKTAKKFKLPIFILGGGSNILVSEKGFDGLVIKINVLGSEFAESRVFAGAGESLSELAYTCADRGLSGLEWAAGIPGVTVGGAIFGHAQAFGEKISDAVKSVEAIDLDTLEIKNFNREQCQFSLKSSIFKKNRNFVILSAVFKFKKKNPCEIKNKIRENMNYRKTRHPMNFPSAGSTFINPEIHLVKSAKGGAKQFNWVKIKDKKLLERFPELKEYNKKGVIPAGYLILKCGLAGKKIGSAQFSEQHANFIINLGRAKSEDVSALINLAKKKVKKVFGIKLVPEVQFVGFTKPI